MEWLYTQVGTDAPRKFCGNSEGLGRSLDDGNPRSITGSSSPERESVHGQLFRAGSFTVSEPCKDLCGPPVLRFKRRSGEQVEIVWESSVGLFAPVSRFRLIVFQRQGRPLARAAHGQT